MDVTRGDREVSGVGALLLPAPVPGGRGGVGASTPALGCYILFIITDDAARDPDLLRFHLLLLPFYSLLFHLLRRLLQILLSGGFNEWLLMMRVCLRADFSL